MINDSTQLIRDNILEWLKNDEGIQELNQDKANSFWKNFRTDLQACKPDENEFRSLFLYHPWFNDDKRDHMKGFGKRLFDKIVKLQETLDAEIALKALIMVCLEVDVSYKLARVTDKAKAEDLYNNLNIAKFRS